MQNNDTSKTPPVEPTAEQSVVKTETMHEIVNENKSGNGMVWVVVILVLAALAVGGYILVDSMNSNTSDSTQQSTTTGTDQSSTDTESSEVSDADDTATIEEELNNTILEDTSSTDSATINQDLKELE